MSSHNPAETHEKHKCRECGQPNYHKPSCRFNTLIGKQTPVLDSERSPESQAAETHEFKTSEFLSGDRCAAHLLVSGGYASNMCGQPKDAAIHRAETPADDAQWHSVKCNRWQPYDHNHSRYYPQRTCSCGQSDRLASDTPTAAEGVETVESVTAELRKLWPDCSFRIREEWNAGFYKDAIRHFEIGLRRSGYFQQADHFA